MSVAGDVGITVRQVADELSELKAAYDASDDEKCNRLLVNIKRRLIHFPTFLSPAVTSPTRPMELMLAREVLEYGVLCSARQKDLEEFALYFSQLQVYYSDVSREDLPESPRYLMIVGLNLVRLLVMDRIAQFHSELERIPYEAHGSNTYIRYAVQMERHLMEGSYNKLLNSRKKAPSNEYLPVVEMLELTVRHKVAECIPHAYTELSVPAAQRILMVASPEEVLQIGQDNEWTLSPDRKRFLFTREEDVAKRQIPFETMIDHHIKFAADLQNIV